MKTNPNPADDFSFERFYQAPRFTFSNTRYVRPVNVWYLAGFSFSTDVWL